MKLVLLLITLLSQPICFAQWNGNSDTGNNVISTVSNYWGTQLITTDHYGGAIAAFQSGNNIYAQRKTVGGQLKWGTVSAPLLVYAGSAATNLSDMISDDNGGVYISFHEKLNDSTTHLYLKHIAANGDPANNVLINPPGMMFCGESKLCLSGENVFVVWSTEQVNGEASFLNSNIYFQKFDKAGTVLLTPGAQKVSSESGSRSSPVVSSDSSGGMYIAFTDTRNITVDFNGTINNYDVYAQHFDANGNKLWPANDLVINNTPVTNQFTYQDVGPPFIRNRRSSITMADGNWNILYGNDIDTLGALDNVLLEAKKLSFNGSEMWNEPVKTTPNTSTKNFLSVEPDNNNGLVLSWRNTGTSADIYAQRIAANGSLPWGANGIKITPESDMDFNMTSSHMAKTGDGEYVIAWRKDTIKTDLSDNAYFIKAQRFNDEGQLLWQPNGINVCNNENVSPIFPSIIRSLDSNAIISWKDSRGINTALLKRDGTLTDIANINYTAVASGNWNDPAIWSTGVVPPPGANLIISQTVTVNINVICNTITVLPPAILTVNPGVSITVFNN